MPHFPVRYAPAILFRSSAVRLPIKSQGCRVHCGNELGCPPITRGADLSRADSALVCTVARNTLDPGVPWQNVCLSKLQGVRVMNDYAWSDCV